MSKERDKYLTEAMGLCYHDIKLKSDYPRDTLISYCSICGEEYVGNIDFSTWEGFGKLWEWAKEQKWWDEFRRSLAIGFDQIIYFVADLEPHIHPDRFADAVYNFLRRR